MADCCTNATCEIEKLQTRQSHTLKIVLGINAGMFIVEIVSGIMARSTALLADSLDMLGDALVYGVSLYVVKKNDFWKAMAALFKGLLMLVFGGCVLAEGVYKLLYPAIPSYETIGVIGLLALSANGVCFLLLRRHRSEDINMRSVWLCSRNDILANVLVLIAAAGVWMTASQWPDLLVGLGIATIFLRSAFFVIRDAWRMRMLHHKTRTLRIS
ncbi:MAG: cation diffusion facilitator family transporter [Nitrospirales bacterium]|nr:cation diffusion facilitator family transporter [Nitrospirales bacterium]